MKLNTMKLNAFLVAVLTAVWITKEVHGLRSNRDRPQPLGDPGATESQHDSRAKLIVSTILQEPYVMLKQDGFFLTGNDRYEGFLADLLAALSHSVGFGYELRLVRDGKFGGEGENGTRTGMIGEVHKGMADLAVGPITITDDRSKVVDFTEPFLTYQSCAVIKKPRHGNHRNNNRKPRSKSRFKTLDDVFHQSEYDYGVVTGSLTQAIFQESHEDTIQAMWSKMVMSWPSAFVLNYQEGIQRARREKYAFILDCPMAEYITAQKPCDLYRSEKFLSLQHYGFALRHSHSIRLRESLNEHLRNMKASGQFQALYEKWWQNQCDKKRDSGEEEVKVPMVTDTPSPWGYVTVKANAVRGLATTPHHHNVLWHIFTMCSFSVAISKYIISC